MRFGDAEISEHQRSGFGLHRAAAIGMQSKLAWGDIMLDDGVVEQGFEQRGAFRVGDAPGNDPAAENINDDIEIEVAPFRRPHQLRYVPGPNLIWAFGEKFGLLVDGAPQLPAPFAGGLRHARRERDTWCGSSTDRRPGRAGWRRLRLEPNRQTAALSTGRGRLGVLVRQAPAAAVAVGAQAQAAVSGRLGGDEGWRATAPALCRRRRSSRCLAPRPPPRPSRLAVARSWEAQQHRNFFLDFD